NHTEVLWYLKAIDLSGNVEEKYDLTGSYFSYEVGILVNPFIAQTPGFTIWTVLASIGLGVYLISKRRE
ncbi:MAG: Loki-CTERM sorting domain-containing protein, partial [Candidatus Hodarchaeales archaeon]